MVWLRSEAFSTYAAICVSNADRRGGRLRVVTDPCHEEWLDLVPDDRRPDPLEQATQGGGVVGALDRDRPTVHPGQREGERVAAAGSRIVEKEAHADGRLGGQPWLESRDPIATDDRDPRGVHDGRGQRGWQVGRWTGLWQGAVRRLVGPDGAAPVLGGLRRTRHGIEVERQLEPATLRRRTGRAAGAPARRPGTAGDPGRRHRTVGGHAAEGLGRVAGGLAGHRREPLDQRPELVLAEQTG